MSTTTQSVSMLPTSCLVEMPGQPRRSFDAASLEALAASIRRDGIIEPLIVRPGTSATLTNGPFLSNDAPNVLAHTNTYQIVCGERRWKAARLAGLESVPCLVRLIDDADVPWIQLVENLQRVDLCPVDEGDAYRELRAAGYSPSAIGERVGRSERHVQRRLRLADAPDQIRALVSRGEMSAGAALAVARLADTGDQAAAIEMWRQKPQTEAAFEAAVAREWTRNLGAAEFHQDVPLAGKMPCEACPMREGDTCLFAACYAEKEAVGTPGGRRQLSTARRRVLVDHTARRLRWQRVRDAAGLALAGAQKITEHQWLALVVALGRIKGASEVFVTRGHPEQPTVAQLEELTPPELRACAFELALLVVGPERIDDVIEVWAEAFAIDLDELRRWAKVEAREAVPTRKMHQAAKAEAEEWQDEIGEDT